MTTTRMGYDYEGNLLSKYSYNKDNQLHGLTEKYYNDGSIWYKCYYENGILNGPYEKYYNKKNSIQLKEKNNYKNGNYYGRYQTWYENGNKHIEQYYNDNHNVHGLYQIRNEDGYHHRWRVHMDIIIQFYNV